MPALISNLGEKLDLRMRQGSTWGPFRVTLTNPDETPIDLTGATVRVLMECEQAPSMSVGITDAITGEFEFGLDAEVTADVPATGSPMYPWYIELEDSTGRVLPLTYGLAQVFKDGPRDGFGFRAGTRGVGSGITIESPNEITLKLEIGQGPAGAVGGVWTPSAVVDCAYDSEGRITGYTQDGDAYNVDYTDADRIVITGGGRTKTVTLSAPDRIESIVTT